MSHIVEAITKIKTPNIALLRRAVAIVAQLHEGGRVSDTYQNFSRRPQIVATGIALYTDQMSRGIGLDIENGYLKFVGDPWEVEDLFQQVQDEIKQTYVSLALVEALNQMGCETALDENEHGHLVVRGTLNA